MAAPTQHAPPRIGGSQSEEVATSSYLLPCQIPQETTLNFDTKSLYINTARLIRFETFVYYTQVTQGDYIVDKWFPHIKLICYISVYSTLASVHCMSINLIVRNIFFSRPTEIPKTRHILHQLISIKSACLAMKINVYWQIYCYTKMTFIYDSISRI